MGTSLAKQLMSSQKIFAINKVHYFDILVSCLHAFNTLLLTLKTVGDDLGYKCNKIQKPEERQVLQNYQYKGKGVRKETIFFIFRLNIALRDSYQAEEIVMKTDEWKQKFPGNYVKSFIRVLLRVFKTSIVP